MEELMEVIRSRMTVTAYDRASKKVYIAKSKDSWYPSLQDVLFENGIEFETEYFKYEDVFKLDIGMTIVVYEEED